MYIRFDSFRLADTRNREAHLGGCEMPRIENVGKVAASSGYEEGHDTAAPFFTKKPLSRRQALIRMLGATGAAATAWFLPPELRGSVRPAHAAYLCLVGVSRRCYADTCTPCSGNQTTVSCRFEFAWCDDFCTCEDCMNLFSCYYGTYFSTCCLQNICGPCGAYLGSYCDECL
jgi:hypothetical protein